MTVDERAHVAGEAVAQRARGARYSVLRALAPLMRWWDDVAAHYLAQPIGVLRKATRAPSWVAWALILVGLGLVLAGSIWRWGEVVAMGVAGLVLVGAATPFLFGSMGHRATLDLNRSRVVVGERAMGALEVINPAGRAASALRVELQVGYGVAEFSIPRLAAGERHEDLFTIPTQKRTVLQVGPLRALRGDPLGLVARDVVWAEPVELFVHPRTVSLDGSSKGFLQDLEGLPTRDLSNSDVSFHALREYAPGDDRRHVHWRSSARTGQLMVRQFEETRRSHLAVALSANEEEYRAEEDFELAVSCAGSLALQALREEKQVTLMLQSGTVPSRTGRRLLDGLSAVEPTPLRRGTLTELAGRVGLAVPGASVAMLVTGPRATPAHLRRAAARIPVGVQVVALICEAGAALTRHRIGDISVLTVGDLSDLPPAMRRLS
ncbi:DUF58 domain-containing protein [Demequina sp. NBRC 110054]|uniref:DUF58 domain-containing protein n=1 Tax=Demequina sp. NBRC 110054 TaxID=1570343 RepID=UPI000A0252B5|nr:DUF58 domain-containing protein [Demequina sp. NBRC 110054]